MTGVAKDVSGGAGRAPRAARATRRRAGPDARQKWSSRRWTSRPHGSGSSSVEDERIITFPSGLLGFPDHTRFALIQTGEENYFFWLQSVDEPNLAFVVTDPTIFFKDYQVPVREETWQDLQLADEGDVQCFVICNKVGEWLTGNLLGPIVVNAANRARAAGRADREEVDDPPAAHDAPGGSPPLAKSA